MLNVNINNPMYFAKLKNHIQPIHKSNKSGYKNNHEQHSFNKQSKQGETKGFAQILNELI